LHRSLPEFHSSRLDRAEAEASKGARLARHEGDFRSTAEEPLSFDELLAVLGRDEKGEARSREDAIACALSASEGWQEAVKRLRGAFAEEAARLRERKAE
jgi:hypothetical protein